MTKTGLIVRHVPYEGIAGFRPPIEAAGYELSRIDVGDPTFSDTDLTKPDLLILMGGPMGVYETEAYPWITHELERLRNRLLLGLPTLGVCLGSQMIAAALGADVYPGPEKEIGFAKIELTHVGTTSPLAHLSGAEMLHWHGDTFDLPHGTEWLARTEHYPHQAFRKGKTVLALQFHAEMGTDPRIDTWIDHSTDALRQMGLSGAELRADYDLKGPDVVYAGQRMIAHWLAELSQA